MPYNRERNGMFSDILNSNPLALKYLMKALMAFYVEVEVTGSHTQFYDKFYYRSVALPSATAY